MGIVDVVIACSFDDSQEYCTYDNPILSMEDYEIFHPYKSDGYSLMLIASKHAEQNKIKSFEFIEDLIERVISHETIHIVIKKLEDREVSDKLDDLEILFPLGRGRTHIIKMNFLGYASDNTGLVLV